MKLVEDTPFVSIRGISAPSGVAGLFARAAYDEGMEFAYYVNTETSAVLVIDVINTIGWGAFATWTVYSLDGFVSLFTSNSSDISHVPEDAAWTNVASAEQEPGGLIVEGLDFSAVQVEIGTADELQAIALSTTFLAYNYIQTANIDLDIEPYDVGSGFQPIGTLAHPFEGKYDGGNHIISNLFINLPTTTYVGLFGYLDCSDPITTLQFGLTNMHIDGANVTGQDKVGVLFGKNAITTCNCSVKNAVVVGRDVVGGVFGRSNLYRNFSIPGFDHYTENVWGENLTVTGRDGVGGIAGQIILGGKNIYTKGTIVINVLTHNARRSVGIVAGYANGWGDGREVKVCENIFAVATINVALPTEGAETSLGGFSGRVNDGNYKNCYVRGTINLEAGEWPGSTYIGAFSGRPLNTLSTWLNCYASCGIDAFFGGPLVEGSTVTSCYFEGTDAKNDQGAIGKTAAKLKDEDTFVDWNFRTLWEIAPLVNDGYPFINPRKLQSGYPGLYLSLFRKR